MKIYLDTETRSEVPIRQGTARYVRGKYFKPLLVPWALDDGPVKLWSPCRGEPMPVRLKLALAKPEAKLIFHNSTFDRNVINQSMLFGRVISAEEIVDTMVQALAHCLPGALGKLSEIFGLENDLAKEKDGKALIQQFCVPVRGRDDVAFYDWTTHPDDWARFERYAVSDILAMREVHKRMPTMNYPDLEHGIWALDQRINDRGLPVDVELAEAAMVAAAAERKVLNASTAELTNEEVQAATQRDKLLKHIAKEHDVWLPDLKTSTLERRLDDPELPTDLRELMILRLQSSKNSAAKYRRLVQHQAEGRLSYTMQMYGAMRTGRDAGRVFQPQNLMRPTMWRGLSGAELEAAIAADVAAIKSGMVEWFHSDVMDVLGNCIRSSIIAKPGRKLVGADLSNIEGRGLVWLSNEQWKLDYFRRYDAGEIKYDNYVMAYAKAMNVSPADVDDYMRQIGKVMELGLGYGGGVAAFITFANVYRLDIQELATAVWSTGDQARLRECANKHEWAKSNGYHAGLNEFQYAACEYLKQLWREAHPLTVDFWAELENAFRMATAYAGENFKVGRLIFRRQGQWLYVRLPSGRCIVYLQPKIINNNCTFVGQDPFTKQFKRVKTYSGRLSENVTSGSARDVMFHRLPDVEAEGYPVVLRVHDELLAETEDSPEYSGEGLAEIMARPHPWSDGLPLAAAGTEMHIYHKT